MLTTLLLLIGKGLITGVASKGGQILVDKLKEYFGASLGEKIGDAYVKASEEYTKFIGEEIDFNYLGDKPYYENLLYSFNIIDGNDLSDYYKRMSKLFLIEIFKTPEFANQVFNIKLDNIQKDVTILKNTFIGNLNSYTHDKFISEKDFSDFPIYYIPRSLIPNTDFFTERHISSFNEFIEYAQNSTNDNKSIAIRALILADGGIGKSVYLKYLAKDCLKNEQFYPVFISLRDLKSTDILQEYIERRFPDLKKIDTKEYNQLCFFLDGFDEIGDSSAAIKQIGDLCSTYLESHIILTSRRNSFFSDLPDFSNHLIFTLLDLNQKDIETYIQANYTAYKIDTNHFSEEVLDNNFRNLIYNPFYLKALIDCYIKGGNSLKISKKDLIDSLITQRREKDKTKRPDLELDKSTTKLKTSKLAKQFALTQALMDQRSLSDSYTATLFSDDFDLAINSLPIRKGSILDNEQQWEFEHNIFLEHIVSDILKDLTIEQIIEYGSSCSKIKSKWRDIISHLLGILDKKNTQEETLYNELTNWLIKNDPEILLGIEESQLSQEMRSGIFLQVYIWYQEKTIWLDTNKFNLKQMALFGETKENVNLLFECITSDQEHFRRRINAALLFKNFTFKHFTPEERLIMSNHYAQTIYKLPTLDFENSETIEQHLISSFPFKNDAEAIVEHYRTTNSSQLISSILHLIDAYDLQDKCIDIILDFNTKNQRSQTIGNYYINTSLCLFGIKEESSFIKFFDSLLNENLYYEYSSYRKDDFKIVIENCKKYSSDELIKSIINLSSKHASWTLSQEWELFSSFFEDENIRDKSIKILLDILSSDIKEEMRLWMYSHTLARIVKTKYLPTIFKSVDSIDLYLAIIRYSAKESEIYGKVLDHLK